MFKGLIVSMFVLGMSVTAFADRVIGNGGHAVECRQANGGTTFEVLDAYEARFSKQIRLGDENLSVDEKVQLAISRLEAFPTLLHLELYNRLNEFNNAVSIRYDIDLPETRDTGRISLGQNCKAHQLAVQFESVLPGSREFVIQGRIWEKLSNDQRAVLVLHELIYGSFSTLGASDSYNARLLNRLLITDSLKNYSRQQFFELMNGIAASISDSRGYLDIYFGRKIGTYVPGRANKTFEIILGEDAVETMHFRQQDGRVQTVRVKNHQFKPDRYKSVVLALKDFNLVLLRGHLVDPLEVTLGGHVIEVVGDFDLFDTYSFRLATPYTVNINGCQVTAKRHLSFYDDLNIESVGTNESSTVCTPQGEITVQGFGEDSSIYFHRNGVLSFATLNAPTKLKVGEDRAVKFQGAVRLYPSGRVMQGTLAEAAGFGCHFGGRSYHLAQGSFVETEEDGHIGGGYCR